MICDRIQPGDCPCKAKAQKQMTILKDHMQKPKREQ